jgi:membrane protease YdiL (CAAX protease family)
MSQQLEHVRPTDPDIDDVPQYSLRRVLVIWAAATVPMSVLSWLVAPWAAEQFTSRNSFADSLLVAFDLGLAGQVVLVLAVVRAERGSLAWSEIRAALRLGPPRDPRTGRVGGRVWWWALAFTALSAGIEMLPLDPTGPLNRDLPKALQAGTLDHYFSGNWTAFALLAVNALISPVAEELVFRGLLLPRMRGAFGNTDILANGLLFSLYHLHQPWSIPVAFLDGAFGQAWPSRRFRSTWMGIITHTAPSVLVIGFVLVLVLHSS